MTPAGHGTRRPRTDARRNRERLLAAAREVFAEAGPDASLNEIARRADVGPGTLYRHFPTRHALLTAVVRDRVETLCEQAAELLTADRADDGLDRWLRIFLAHARTSQGLTGAWLVEGAGEPAFDCHRMILDAATALLTRAQRHGTARPDLTPADLLQLVVGIALSTARAEDDPARSERLLAITLDAVHSPARR